MVNELYRLNSENPFNLPQTFEEIESIDPQILMESILDFIDYWMKNKCEGEFIDYLMRSLVQIKIPDIIDKRFSKSTSPEKLHIDYIVNILMKRISESIDLNVPDLDIFIKLEQESFAKAGKIRSDIQEKLKKKIIKESINLDNTIAKVMKYIKIFIFLTYFADQKPTFSKYFVSEESIIDIFNFLTGTSGNDRFFALLDGKSGSGIQLQKRIEHKASLILQFYWDAMNDLTKPEN